MNAEDYNKLTTEELKLKLAQAHHKITELERRKRRVGLSFRRVPESGTQITRLFQGDFPYLQRIPSLSYTLDNRHVDEKAAGIALSTPTDGNITLIEADNLAALTLLQLTHRGRVDVIYIDPPYNTGNNDFIYNDARKSSIADIEGASVEDYEAKLDGKARNIGKDDPERHSLWLSFMEKRLFLAKELLSENGIIFVSIDDNEQARLKMLMDEVFGEQNFVSSFIWKSKSGGGNDSSIMVSEHEYILVFAKDKGSAHVLSYNDPKLINGYTEADEFVTTRGKYKIEALYRSSLSFSDSLVYPIKSPDGTNIWPNDSNPESTKHIWRWSKETFERKASEGRVLFKQTKNGWRVFSKQYMNENDDGSPRHQKIRSVIDSIPGRNGSEEITRILHQKAFNNPKPINLIKRLIGSIDNQNAIILDFFAGSGTTGQAVAELNKEDGGSRQCILVTHGDENGKNIAEDITAERIKRVLSGKEWADKKNHEGIPGELNYYKLAFAPKTSNPMKAVETMQSKFVGLASLEQDSVLNTQLTSAPANYVVLTSSKKIVVVVKNEEYLLDEFDSFVEVLETLKTLEGYHNFVIYVPSESEEDDYGFEELGWAYIPFPVEYLKAHGKLIDRMKKNQTLLPPVESLEEED